MLKIFLLFILTWPLVLFARPEFALKNNFVSCTVCHQSPVGGGIRNLQGKLYGSHGMKSAKIAEKLDWLQFDLRSEIFQEKNSVDRKGVMLMTATPSVAIPLQFEETGSPPLTLVLSYGLGRLDTGLGETFVKLNSDPDPQNQFFENIIFGRLLPPFGLMTDEHRTYTRLATLSTSRDYEMGVMLSGTPSHTVHYDLAFTNGTQGDIPVSEDAPWGAFVNIRMMPYLGPLMYGLSYSRHGTQKVKIQPEAYDLYALYSFGKDYNKFPVTLISEFVAARGWNNATLNSGSTGGIGYFIPTSEAGWQTVLNDSQSNSLMVQANIDFSQNWVGIIKTEQFTPDINFRGDSFYRTGYGFKWYINGQSSLQARYETAAATRPGITEAGKVKAVGESWFLFYHLWF